MDIDKEELREIIESNEKRFEEETQFLASCKLIHKHAKKFLDNELAQAHEGTQMAQEIISLSHKTFTVPLPHLASGLEKIGATISALCLVRQQYVDQLRKEFLEPLSNFMDYDFVQLFEMKPVVDKALNEYRGRGLPAILKDSGRLTLSRSQSVVPETDGARKDAEIASQEFTLQLDQQNTYKETKLLKGLHTFSKVLYSHYYSAFKLLSNVKTFLTDIDKYFDNKKNSKVIEGHLMRKFGKTWHRCYFSVRDGQLFCYGKRENESEQAMHLLLCTVRTKVANPEKKIDEHLLDRCFEIINSQTKNFKPIVLQASSVIEKDEWIRVLQENISSLLNAQPARDGTHHVPTALKVSGSMMFSPRTVDKKNFLNLQILKTKRSSNPLASSAIVAMLNAGPESSDVFLQMLRKVPGNLTCADCGAENPDWASISLGILICMECSGIHRSLGTHISKVRSTTLDNWDPELLAVMKRLGNNRVNTIFEAKIDSATTKKPEAKTDRDVKEKWVKSKYVEKLHINALNLSNDEASGQFYDYVKQATCTSDIMPLANLIANGANPNWEVNGINALIEATRRNLPIFVEFLIANGANMKPPDSEERCWTPHHYAAYLNHAHISLILLRHERGGRIDRMLDMMGRSPFDIANEFNSIETLNVLKGDQRISPWTLPDVDNDTIPRTFANTLIDPPSGFGAFTNVKSPSPMKESQFLTPTASQDAFSNDSPPDASPAGTPPVAHLAPISPAPGSPRSTETSPKGNWLNGPKRFLTMRNSFSKPKPQLSPLPE